MTAFKVQILCTEK